MPAITKGSKVLVSGANGYIGMWVGRILLERGSSVRGTVRSHDKGDFLVKYFTALGYGDLFEYIIVTDFDKEGAFDEAVKGVEGIEHTASPFNMDIKNPNEMVVPAIRGTTGILESVVKHGYNVKRIVVTSSCATVYSPELLDRPNKYSEENWNTISTKDLELLGDETPPMTVYRASKVLAERAAWEFYESRKGSVAWDLVVINPPLVFGPPINDLKTPASLNASIAYWYDAVFGRTENFKRKEGLAVSNSWADVRDVSLGHVLALETPDAAGQRIITSAGGYIWQEWLDLANALQHIPLKAIPQKGIPEILKNNSDKVVLVSYDQSKQSRILGLQYHTQLETARDTLEEFSRRGW